MISRCPPLTNCLTLLKIKQSNVEINIHSYYYKLQKIKPGNLIYLYIRIISSCLWETERTDVIMKG